MLTQFPIVSISGPRQSDCRILVSVLEASYVVFRLRPYYLNSNTRITKAPKMYFYDTGLLCYLLGLRRKEDLAIHFAQGAIFENFVILEVMKVYFNQG